MKYSKAFFERQEEATRKSAKEVVPIIIELFHPKSVIDVGCGTGAWLSTFKEYGVNDVLGIDGEYVDRKMLNIPEEQFLPADLSKPLYVDRKFDLVLSLEVAEHLPRECADVFVDSLVRLGKVICFSAAIPFQGGTNHINEQWPEYWVNLFQKRKYVVQDCIRKKLWHNKHIYWCYIQNTLFFIEQNYLRSCPTLITELDPLQATQISIVHPRTYMNLALSLQPRNMPFRLLLLNILLLFAALPGAAIRVFIRRIKLLRDLPR